MSGATQNKDGTKKRWIHGRAVQDGKVRFLSVSSLEKGDSSKPTGCLRRWHYQYIGGIKEPPSDRMVDGERMHGEIAHYLTTGENIMSSQVLAGMHMIPEPGPDLLVEHDVVPPMPDGRSGIDIAPLRASGIPIVGAIDLIHARGTNTGTEDTVNIYDPKGTVEVIDWKSCRTLDNTKNGPELLKSIQMAGYGKYVFETEKEAELVRLSHGYFPSRGTPKKTTIRVDRDQIEKSWEHANRVASSISDAAKESNPDLVEANTDACNSYGRECPARSVCKAAQQSNLSKFIVPIESVMSNTNSILAGIKARQAESNLPEPRPNRSIFSQVLGEGAEQPKKTDEDEVLKAEMAKLEIKERLAKGPDLLPPDAPDSDPRLASRPHTQNDFTKAMAEVATVDTTEAVSNIVHSVPDKKKPGRKKKETDVVTAPAVTINFFVDAMVEGIEAESYWPVVDRFIEIMREKAGGQDFRLLNDDNFGFGRWKAVLAQMIHQTPLDPGNYQLMHAQGDIAMVVVETMREIVRKAGGMFVVGTR